MSDTEIARKLDAIFAEPVAPVTDANELFERLTVARNLYLTHLTGNPNRDIDRVEIDKDPAYGSNVALYYGSWEKLCRVEFGVQVLSDQVVIALRMTKGTLDVHSTEYGQQGAEIGNSVMVGRLLHVGICTFRRAGLLKITNQPHDERLRRHYSLLGFVGGEILPLNDRAQIEAALIAIRKLYSPFGLDLAGPPP